MKKIKVTKELIDAICDGVECLDLPENKIDLLCKVVTMELFLAAGNEHEAINILRGDTDRIVKLTKVRFSRKYSRKHNLNEEARQLIISRGIKDFPELLLNIGRFKKDGAFTPQESKIVDEFIIDVVQKTIK